MAGSGQTEKHVLVLNQKRAKTNLKISVENNLNRNTEAVSMIFFCEKGVHKNFIIFTGKHPCRSLSFNKVACLKPAVYYKKRLRHSFLINFAKVVIEHLFRRTYVIGCCWK